MSTQASTVPLLLAMLLWLGGCSAPGKNQPDLARLSPYQPRLNGTLAEMDIDSVDKLQQLQLVATDLVSTLLQVPDYDPTTMTLQVAPPASTFGNTLLRALEDAGYGLQWVSADQGSQYVSYSRRFAETDSGPITDFEMTVGAVQIRREYRDNGNAILPSSLMQVNGTPAELMIELNEDMFLEQGGQGEVFISGVINPEMPTPDADIDVDEFVVNEYNELPEGKRTGSASVLSSVRRYVTRQRTGQQNPDMHGYQRLRRTVLLFDDSRPAYLGSGNKQAVALMVRDFASDDLFVISACTDADGQNETALARGARVEREFSSHGVPLAAMQLAPCVRTTYHSAADDAPVAVTIVQHRKAGPS